MDTTTTITPELRDAPVDLGYLFGYVTATRVWDSVGAHVKLNPDCDESVIGNTNLRALPEDADPLDVARALRTATADAIVQAAREIGAPVGWDEARRLAATLIPLTPILEAMVEAEQCQ